MIHHITAISSSAQKTVNFYRDFLGLRLVKKTVNFDAPDVYHLYFGDEIGSPGTIITFFPFEDAGTGMRGTGQVTTIGFAIPKESLGFWIERSVKHRIKHSEIKSRFNQKYITVYDFDGLELELIGVDTSELKDSYVWNGSPIDSNHQIRSFYTATLSVTDKDKTIPILEDIGYVIKQDDDHFTRLHSPKGTYAQYIDIFHMPGWPEGIQSAGTVHHIAFSVDNEKEEMAIREKMVTRQLHPTEQVDRKYFKSVYFREPNGILFELATLQPGFLIDESLEELGTTLPLPDQYESRRTYIEAILPPIDTTRDDADLGYDHIFIKGSSERTLVMFHGTGADEKDLIPFAQQLDSKANILTLRGKENENGVLRFFKRYEDGTFDKEDIKKRSAEIAEFLKKAINHYSLSEDQLVLVGFSNGANIIASMILLGTYKPARALLLRPTFPIESNNNLDLKSSDVLIASGEEDPYASKEDVDRLVTTLKSAGANVQQEFTASDHSFSMEDISAGMKWLNSI